MTILRSLNKEDVFVNISRTGNLIEIQWIQDGRSLIIGAVLTELHETDIPQKREAKE